MDQVVDSLTGACRRELSITHQAAEHLDDLQID
jgi:hypothetical protein